MKIIEFVKTTLVGVSQIFLQENGLTGLFIVIGMFFSHWALGVSCILGSLLGTLTAILLKFKQENIKSGLYGFNASLAFMCAIFTFGLVQNANTDAYSFVVWFIGGFSAIIATIIMHLFIKKGKVAYTFPFVVTCWFSCYLLSNLNFLGLEQTTPMLASHTSTIEAIKSPFFGWAEVNFGGSFITGIFIFLGIAIANVSTAMWATTAAINGSLFAFYILGIDDNALANGIYSFSPILVACAFVGEKFRNFVYVLFGTLLAVLIQFAVSNITIVSNDGWAAYTFGFILASWIILLFKTDKELTLKRIKYLLNP